MHLQRLPETIFKENLKNIFSAISEALHHIYVIDQLWFQRISGVWCGNSSPFTNVQDAGERFEELHLAMREYMFLNLEGSEVVYTNSHGIHYSNTLEELMLHLANHGTYHRGNIAAMLRQLGSEGIATDFIVFLREG